MAAWRQLDRLYQDLWLKWESQEGEVRQDSQEQAHEEERQAFINSLISQVGPLTSCHLPAAEKGVIMKPFVSLVCKNVPRMSWNRSQGVAH